VELEGLPEAVLDNSVELERLPEAVLDNSVELERLPDAVLDNMVVAVELAVLADTLWDEDVAEVVVATVVNVDCLLEVVDDTLDDVEEVSLLLNTATSQPWRP
jgi:hypothetical protein